MNMNHTILVSSIDHIVLSEAAAGFDYILDIGTTGAVDVVPEWYKGI